MTGFVFDQGDRAHGADLTLVTNGSVQRCLHIASANEWEEIAGDCREELQRRACQPDTD